MCVQGNCGCDAAEPQTHDEVDWADLTSLSFEVKVVKSEDFCRVSMCRGGGQGQGQGLARDALI